MNTTEISKRSLDRALSREEVFSRRTGTVPVHGTMHVLLLQKNFEIEKNQQTIFSTSLPEPETTPTPRIRPSCYNYQ
jgi:hypothetical protein